jgi:hypothetical protein
MHEDTEISKNLRLIPQEIGLIIQLEYNIILVSEIFQSFLFKSSIKKH